MEKVFTAICLCGLTFYAFCEIVKMVTSRMASKAGGIIRKKLKV